jgi:hypothetical protein
VGFNEPMTVDPAILNNPRQAFEAFFNAPQALLLFSLDNVSLPPTRLPKTDEGECT